jgi:hypothetical protein
MPTISMLICWNLSSGDRGLGQGLILMNLSTHVQALYMSEAALWPRSYLEGGKNARTPLRASKRAALVPSQRHLRR